MEITHEHDLSPEEILDKVTVTEGYVMLDDNASYTLMRTTLTENSSIISFAILRHCKSGVPYHYDDNIILDMFTWELVWFQTDPLYQRKGYGKQLFAYMKSLITEPILLLALPKAVQFYLHQGAYLLSDFECVYEKCNVFMFISDLTSFEEYEQLYQRWNQDSGNSDEAKDKYQFSIQEMYSTDNVTKKEIIERIFE